MGRRRRYVGKLDHGIPRHSEWILGPNHDTHAWVGGAVWRFDKEGQRALMET